MIKFDVLSDFYEWASPILASGERLPPFRLYGHGLLPTGETVASNLFTFRGPGMSFLISPGNFIKASKNFSSETTYHFDQSYEIDADLVKKKILKALLSKFGEADDSVLASLKRLSVIDNEAKYLVDYINSASHSDLSDPRTSLSNRLQYIRVNPI